MADDDLPLLLHRMNFIIENRGERVGKNGGCFLEAFWCFFLFEAALSSSHSNSTLIGGPIQFQVLLNGQQPLIQLKHFAVCFAADFLAPMP
jgi:hypothetical protein